MKACTDLAQETLLSLIDLTDSQPTLPRKIVCASALMIACIPCLVVLDIAHHWGQTDPDTFDADQLYN